MKPDFEKMARCIASDIVHGNSAVAAVAKELSRLYAAGYRDGQIKMRVRAAMVSDRETASQIDAMAIEEPPT